MNTLDLAYATRQGRSARAGDSIDEMLRSLRRPVAAVLA